MKQQKILVLIPAFNEEKSIGILVENILQNKKISACIIIDDKSKDNTASVAKNAGAMVIKKTKNEGTGSAVKIGLQNANKQGADIVVVMDADGQHNPAHIPILIEKLTHGYDYVIASRYLNITDHVTSYVRRIGTKIISLLFWLTYKKKIMDPTSGYRVMNKQTLRFLVNSFPTTFAEPETIMLLSEYNFKIAETPVQMNKRAYGKSSISKPKAFFLMSYICIQLIQRTVFKHSRHFIYNR